jgi:transcriptional regulator with XRE-family HTH domain
MEKKAPKIFLWSNLKFLRKRRKMSQSDLAESLGVTRSKLALIEDGRTKSMEPEFQLGISEYFKISVDTLLKVDLAKVGELKLRELEAGNDIYIRGGNLRVLAITVDKDEKENTEYVPVSAKAGYSSGYNDPQFIAQLPKFSLPNLPQNKSFRMFPITGDSMLPVMPGSEIIAEYIEDWKGIKAQTPCIVIMNGQQDFVFKMVTFEKRGFLLESLNPAYKPYHVEAGDIIEIWRFYSYHSRQMPEAVTEMREVKGLIHQVLSEMELLKKKQQ